MAVGTITRFSEGIGVEQYDAVIEKVDLTGEPVEGLIFHSAGELEGRFQVFNVWESRENFDRFTTDRLRPAMVEVMGEERVAALPDAERGEASGAPAHGLRVLGEARLVVGVLEPQGRLLAAFGGGQLERLAHRRGRHCGGPGSGLSARCLGRLHGP